LHRKVLWNERSFRIPGKIVGREGDNYQLTVSVPSDEHGFFGRQRQAGDQVFRLMATTTTPCPTTFGYGACTAVTTTNTASSITAQCQSPQQRNRVMRAAGNLGEQIIGQVLDEMLDGFVRRANRKGYRSPARN